MMTLTLDLPLEMEKHLQAAAARHGLPLQEYAVRAMLLGMEMEATDRSQDSLPTTGAEALAYWKREGVLGLFQDRPDTAEFARELRRQAETREPQAREANGGLNDP
jgi:hypothetical protein